MATRSMTGFGAALSRAAGVPWRIEVRALNFKGLDIKLRLPRGLLAIEPDMVAAVRSRVRRGALEVMVRAEVDGDSASRAVVDRALAASLVSALRDVRQELGLADDVTLATLAAVEGIVRVEDVRFDPDAARDDLLAGLEQALDALDVTRATEGARLAADLIERLAALSRLADALESEAESVRSDGRDRLVARWSELTAGLEGGPDAGRLEQELAQIVDRADVTEEIVRLRAHVAEATALLGADHPEPAGRRLVFLAQEMQRETATIAAKSGRLSVTRLCIDARCEVERVREQVMNLE